MARMYRFIGDPTGYRVEDDQAHAGWVDGYKGITDVWVRVNLDQAYVMEEWPLWGQPIHPLSAHETAI